MDQEIDQFARSLPSNASAVFYFAGHGVATNSDNYLIPINTNLRNDAQLPDRTVGLRSIAELLRTSNADGTNILLLDACRDNPLSGSFRSGKRGLQKLKDVPRGVFIGYAAESGQVAYDNIDGENGTYTGQLLESLSRNPNTSIETLHKEIADKVYDITDGEQFPVSEYQIYGQWCFGICIDSTQLPLQPEQTAGAQVQINKIKPAKNYWKVVGGVVAGLLVVGYATRDRGGTNSTSSGVDIELRPPGQ